MSHHYKSCELVRNAYAQSDTSINQSTPTPGKAAEEEYAKTNICLACEVDRLLLQYFGSSIGRNVARAVCVQPNPVDRYRYSVFPLLTSEGHSSKSEADLRGKPLVTINILAAAWKTSDMDHLAGYEQRDAPEFLHAFLDTVGEHCAEYRKLIQSVRSKALPTNATNEMNDDSPDIIKERFKERFEGTLCSVLVCKECSCKRKIPETFLNISLPLSEHVDVVFALSKLQTAKFYLSGYQFTPRQLQRSTSVLGSKMLFQPAQVWHGSRYRRLVQRKGRQVRRRSHCLGDGASKGVVARLQKLHGWPHPNALNGSSHEVVVEIKCEQAAEGQKLWRESASQLIEIKIDENEICKHSNFGRNPACQTTALHAPNL